MKAKGLAKAKYWITGGVLLVIVVLLGLSRTTLPHLGFINVRGVCIRIQIMDGEKGLLPQSFIAMVNLLNLMLIQHLEASLLSSMSGVIL